MMNWTYIYLVWMMFYLFDITKIGLDVLVMWFLFVVILGGLLLIKNNMTDMIFGKEKSKRDVIIIRERDMKKDMDMEKVNIIKDQISEEVKEDRMCNKIKRILSDDVNIERKLKLMRELVACFDGYEFDENNKDHIKLKKELDIMNKLIVVYDGHLVECKKVVDDVKVEDVKN